MTHNRTAALSQLRRDNPFLEVVLVSPDNLVEWLIPDSPIHPAYERLSLVHRSDYLRSYLMHHHGGGYADIKRDYGDLTPCFDRLENSNRQWLLGYPESAPATCLTNLALSIAVSNVITASCRRMAPLSPERVRR